MPGSSPDARPHPLTGESGPADRVTRKASAVIGPTPGALISRLQTCSLWAMSRTCFVSRPNSRNIVATIARSGSTIVSTNELAHAIGEGCTAWPAKLEAGLPKNRPDHVLNRPHFVRTVRRATRRERQSRYCWLFTCTCRYQPARMICARARASFRSVLFGIVRAGYQRGYGLQYGDLVGQLHQDELYNKAMELARTRTIVAERKRMNLYLILRFGFEGLAPGRIIEFGTYRGGNALFMAAVCRKLHPGMKIYAFDTFEGMPTTDPKRDTHRPGDFKDAGSDELVELIEKRENR